jgi:hypothetical protein
VWHLEVASQRGDAVLYLRGSGSDAYLLALHAGGAVPQIRHVTLRARSAEALAQVAEACARAGGRIVAPLQPADEDPAGGTA